jgi:hypothetical protein
VVALMIFKLQIRIPNNPGKEALRVEGSSEEGKKGYI